MTTRFWSSSSRASPGNSLRMPPLARLPTSSSRPPAPWSVPPESLSSGRRPNSLQIIVSTRCESPRASRSACQARRRVAQVLQQIGVRLRLRVVRVEAAARDRGDARAEARAEQASEVAERLAEIAVGIGHGRRRGLVLLRQRREAVVRLDRVAVHRAHGREGRVLRACPREAAVGRQERLLVPHVRDVEAEVRGRGDAGDGRAVAVQGRILAPADVDALQRVVARRRSRRAFARASRCGRAQARRCRCASSRRS